MTLAHAWVLVLALPVWAAVLAAALASRPRRPGAAARAALTGLATGLLLVALAGPSVQVLRRGGADLCLLRDVSASMTLAGDDAGAHLAAEAAQAVGRADLAVLEFAARPASPPFPPPHDLGRAATNVADALRQAGSLLPEGRGIVLLYSDGRETVGDARQAAAGLAARGIQVHALVPALGPVADARIVSIEPLARPESGRPLAIRVRVASSAPARARLTLARRADGFPPAVREERLNLDGRLGAAVLFEDSLPDVPAVTYQAALDADLDAVADNNRAVLTLVLGPPRLVLYVHRGKQPGQALDWLRRAGRPVIAAPADEGLAIPFEAAAVVLDNVPAWAALGEAAARRLAARVEEGGLGLLVLGGDASFSSGGYAQSPLEAVLPVESRAARRRPLEIVFVIDSSGSMNETSAGVRKITVAKQAVLQLRPVLAEADRVGIVAFAGEPRVVSPLRPLAAWDDLRLALLALEAGGGTRLTPALEAARGLFPPARPDHPAARHVLLLSDGRSEDFDVERLAAAYRAAGTSASAVAAGQDADRARLGRLAHETGGRLYVQADLARLAETFLRDVALARGEGLKAGPAPAAWRAARPIWEAAQAPLPDVPAWNPTRVKEGASLHWASPAAGGRAEVPLLASWRRGMGVVAAMPWPVGEAPEPWRAADALPRYLADVVAYVAGPGGVPDWSARIVERDGRRLVRIEEPAGALAGEGPGFAAVLFTPNAATAAPLAPAQVAPGVFEAGLDRPADVAAAVIVSRRDAPGQRLTLATPGLPPKEFEQFGVARERLEAVARAGGGRVHDSLGSVARDLRAMQARARAPIAPYLVWAAAATAALLVVLRLAGKL